MDSKATAKLYCTVLDIKQDCVLAICQAVCYKAYKGGVATCGTWADPSDSKICVYHHHCA